MHYLERECQNSYVNNLEVNNGRNCCCPESTFTSVPGKDKSISIEGCRSRYAEFIHCHCVKASCHTVRRDREPSRIPVKRLTRVFKKSRKIRRLVKKHIIKNIPRSSRIHIYITFRSARPTVDFSYNTHMFQWRSGHKVKPRKKRVFASHFAIASRRRNHKTTNLKFKV